MRGSAQIVYGNNNWATSIQGVTPEYLSIRDYSIDSGRAFTSQDVDAATKVALLGRTVATNLFGDADPVGQVIRIKNVPFTVSGVPPFRCTWKCRAEVSATNTASAALRVPFSTAVPACTSIRVSFTRPRDGVCFGYVVLGIGGPVRQRRTS